MATRCVQSMAMTKTYPIAHIHEQGQDLIIIPLEENFMNMRSEAERNGIRDALQFFATDAGLKGTVCLVWQSHKVFRAVAPKVWSSFFESIDMTFVGANLNRTLTCDYSQ